MISTSVIFFSGSNITSVFSFGVSSFISCFLNTIFFSSSIGVTSSVISNNISLFFSGLISCEIKFSPSFGVSFFSSSLFSKFISFLSNTNSSGFSFSLSSNWVGVSTFSSFLSSTSTFLISSSFISGSFLSSSIFSSFFSLTSSTKVFFSDSFGVSALGIFCISTVFSTAELSISGLISAVSTTFSGVVNGVSGSFFISSSIGLTSILSSFCSILYSILSFFKSITSLFSLGVSSSSLISSFGFSLISSSLFSGLISWVITVSDEGSNLLSVLLSILSSFFSKIKESGFSLSIIFLLLLSSSIFSFLSIFCCSIIVSPTFSGFNSFSSFDNITLFSLFIGSSSFFISVNSVISFSFLGSSFLNSSESFSTLITLLFSCSTFSSIISCLISPSSFFISFSSGSFVSSFSFSITSSLVLGLLFLPFNLVETISPSGGWVSSSFISTILLLSSDILISLLSFSSSFISSFLSSSSFVSLISISFISFFGSLCGFNSLSLVSFSFSFMTGFSSSKFFKAFSLIKFLSFSCLEYPFLIKLTNLLYLFFCSLFFAFSFIDSMTFCLSFSSKLLIVSAISFIFFSTVLIFLYLSTESSGSSSNSSNFL